jgi:regulatory subunit for Cdc7p protein kinase
VLHRARDMGKKIWSLDKLQKVLDMLLEPNPYRSAALGYGSRSGSAANSVGTSRVAEDPALLQHLLDKERVTGPSDRDPTVASKELVYFKGPYIYIYDIEEKQKPIMVREYAKVTSRTDGDWPQFRTSGSGRCPFIEDAEAAERRMERNRIREEEEKAAQKAIPRFQAPEAPAPKPVIGKRTLAERDDGQNRAPRPAHQRTDSFDSAKILVPPSIDFQPQNAFTSRAKAGRLFAGEPVASGVQRSGVTSAIRSQMISSATGVLGAKAGTSKAVHGLQRKVLQRPGSTSQDLSSRRMAEMSMDHPSFTRSASTGRVSQQQTEADETRPGREEKHKRTTSVPVAPKQKKRDAKPGYCENCQDKFDDFDDVSALVPNL